MKIADPKPVYCSSCFAQQPMKEHVDFQVAWDGPVINSDGMRVPIDDLYVCEDCMLLAFNTLRVAKKKAPVTL
jgi:hypothetical protein